MANAQTDEPTRQKPLRLWPGVIAVMVQIADLEGEGVSGFGV